MNQPSTFVTRNIKSTTLNKQYMNHERPVRRDSLNVHPIFGGIARRGNTYFKCTW